MKTTACLSFVLYVALLFLLLLSEGKENVVGLKAASGWWSAALHDVAGTLTQVAGAELSHVLKWSIVEIILAASGCQCAPIFQL